MFDHIIISYCQRIHTTDVDFYLISFGISNGATATVLTLHVCYTFFFPHLMLTLVERELCRFLFCSVLGCSSVFVLIK